MQEILQNFPFEKFNLWKISLKFDSQNLIPMKNRRKIYEK